MTYMKLKHEVYKFTHEHEEKAKHLWKKDKRKCKKVIIHGIEYQISLNLAAFREILHACQIAQTCKVYDYKQGNEYL